MASMLRKGTHLPFHHPGGWEVVVSYGKSGKSQNNLESFRLRTLFLVFHKSDTF